MEAWMRTQDINGEAALRPQSANPYTSYARESPTSAAAHAYCSNAETSPAPAGYRLNASYSLPTSPIRSSFVNGPNGDLLTAAFGVRASLSPEAASSPAAAASLRWLASQAGRPESAGVSSMGLQLSPIPPVARPSSAAAAAYMGGMVGPVDAAAGFAAGFTAGATAERRSLVSFFGLIHAHKHAACIMMVTSHVEALGATLNVAFELAATSRLTASKWQISCFRGIPVV